MKKIVTLVFAMLLTGSLAFAQTASPSPTPTTKSTKTKKTKKTKKSKKGSAAATPSPASN